MGSKEIHGVSIRWRHIHLGSRQRCLEISRRSHRPIVAILSRNAKGEVWVGDKCIIRLYRSIDLAEGTGAQPETTFTDINGLYEHVDLQVGTHSPGDIYSADTALVAEALEGGKGDAAVVPHARAGKPRQKCTVVFADIWERNNAPT